MPEATFTISDLSREFDVTPRTIRHYEEVGLIHPAREGLQRVYSKRERTRLKLALRGRRLGLSLAEIRELVDMYDDYARDHAPQLTKFLAVLAGRRDALEQQREDIDALLGEIHNFERQCHDLLGTKPARRKR